MFDVLTHPLRVLARTLTTSLLLASFGASAADKPNILVIWGDDIGFWNLSTNNMGMMGYRTPNIDRIANEGAKFTDYYGQQSCTAGRSTFITGQSPIRTGLTKVGIPGADLGIRKEDVTLASLLKAEGYVTAQYGKNHLGDRDEFLPTQHGFDEFFGNLYHLNAEEEPEHPDYPKDPAFRERFGPRGVIRSWADGRVEDTGPLNTKRMETVDKEFLGAAQDFITKSVKEDKPFFVWFNSTNWMNSGLPITPSCSTQRIMALTSTSGLTRVSRRSAVRRIRTGRGATGCPPWCAGRATFRQVRY